MERPDSATLRWCVSSHSDSGTCVEVAVAAEAVFVRHFWNRIAGHIAVSRDAWQAFVDALGSSGAG
ncbi:DUF397 domain-containing protein [Streptomyces echinoruber]|uniref:DUF397 domain-containing protein n=1 Tax=Streptomyces echinoruber TaxID=68898 RepID=A0A918RVD6_9ACTN|nr:DUF397 domain-containing protein [Streptomyces echinoruber]GHA12349.1 hypothetical protein GCM10010389_59110 [Streptomyces echinoruber]